MIKFCQVLSREQSYAARHQALTRCHRCHRCQHAILSLQFPSLTTRMARVILPIRSIRSSRILVNTLVLFSPDCTGAAIPCRGCSCMWQMWFAYASMFEQAKSSKVWIGSFALNLRHSVKLWHAVTCSKGSRGTRIIPKLLSNPCLVQCQFQHKFKEAGRYLRNCLKLSSSYACPSFLLWFPDVSWCQYQHPSTVSAWLFPAFSSTTTAMTFS